MIVKTHYGNYVNLSTACQVTADERPTKPGCAVYACYPVAESRAYRLILGDYPDQAGADAALIALGKCWSNGDPFHEVQPARR